jgi:hypothetical protein
MAAPLWRRGAASEPVQSDRVDDLRWPEDWGQRLAGIGCPLCTAHGRDDNGRGVRVLAGEYADVCLQRAPPTPRYGAVAPPGPRLRARLTARTRVSAQR